MDTLSLSDPAWPKDTSREGDAADKPGRKSAAKKGQSQGLFARARRLPNQLHAKKWIFSRESTRVDAELPVTIRGIGEDGRIFSEETTTLDVSKRGAKIVSATLLAIGTYIWIESPNLQKPTVARVVRHGEQENGSFEICVTLPEIDETESIWNIDSPPNDWKRGTDQPSAARRLERIYARDWVTKFESLTNAPTLSPGIASEPEPSFGPSSAFAGTKTDDSEFKLQPGKILEFVMGEPAKPAQAGATSAGRSEERTLSSSDPMRPGAAADVEIRLAKLTVAMESLEGRVGALAENFQGRIESSLKVFQGQGAKQAEELENVARELAGRWSLQFQEQAAAALATLREEVKNSGQALEQGKQQLAGLAEAKLASLSQTAQDEYAQRLAQALHEQTQEMHAATDGEVKSIREAAAEAIAQLQGKLQEQAQAAVATLHQELKNSSEAVEQSKHQLASLADAKLASLSQATQDEYAQRLAQALREQAQEIHATADGEVNSIRRAAAEAITQLQGKLQSEAEVAVAILREELKNSSEAVELSKQQLASLAEAKLASLSQAAHDEHAQRLAQALREQAQEMHATADGEVKTIRDAAAEAVAQLQGKLQSEAEVAVAILREELKSSSEAVELSKQQLASLADAKLASLSQTTRDEYAQRLAQALHDQTEEMHAAADGEVQSIRQAAAEAVAQLQSRLHGEAEAAVAILREELQTSSQAVEASRQMLVGLAEAKLASLSQATQDEYAQRLSQALRQQAQEMHTAAEGEAKSIREAAVEAIAQLQGKLEQQAQGAVATLQEELRNSIQAVEQSKQQLNSLADAKLASLTQATQDEYAQRLAQALREQAQEMHATADGEVNSIRQAAAEAIAQLQGRLELQAQAAIAALHEELKNSREAVELSKQQLASLADAKLASLSQATQDEYAQRLAQALRDQTQEMHAAADGEVNSIRQAAAEAITQLQDKLQSEAEAAVTILREELKNSREAVKLSEQQLASLADAKLASLSQTTRDEYAQRLAQALREQTQEMHAAADGEVNSIRQAAAEAIATLREELKNSSRQVEEGKLQLASLADAKLASLSQTTRDEYAQRLAQALREQTQEMHAAADGEVKSIRNAAAEAIAQLKAVDRVKESNLLAQAEAAENRLMGVTAAVEALQGRLGALAEELQEQHATKKEALEGMAQQLGARWSQQLQEQAAAAVEAMHARMSALTDDLQARQARKSEDLERVSGELEEKWSQQIQEQAKAAVEALQARVGALADELAEQQSKKAADWERIAQEAGGKWSRQFEEQTEAAVERLRKELENSSRAVEETRKQLASLAETSLATAGQAGHDGSGALFAETLREQLQQIQVAADAEVKSIKQAAEEAIAQAQAEGQRREEDFLARTGVAEERLKAVSLAVETLTESVHGGGALHAVDLDNVAQELGNRMTEQFEKQTELAVDKVRAEVRNAGRAMEELAKQLSGLAETKRASLNQVAANAAAGFEAQQRKLRMQFETARKDLDELVARRMAKLSVGSIHTATESDRKALIVKLAIGAGLFLLMVASLLAVSLSTNTVMQLRNDAPSEFADDNPTWNAKRRAREQEVAQAYWRAAAVTLQAKYPFGSELPADPPADFQVDSTYDPQGGPKALADLRLHYWDKTREAWHQHAFWVEIQEPDTTWGARFHHTWERIKGK